MNYVHSPMLLVAVLAIIILSLTAASGCIQPGNFLKNSSDYYTDTQDSSYFVKASGNLLKIHIFDGTLVENIISPDIFAEIGQYPLINYEMSRISLSKGNKNPLHILKETSETIYIISGKAEAAVNNAYFALSEGDSLFIPKDAFQEIKNTGNTTLLYLSITYPPYESSSEIIADSGVSDTLPSSEYPVHIAANKSEMQVFFEDVEIRKIFDPEILKNCGIGSEFGIGVAKAKIPIESSTQPHILEGTTEVMYILKGEGILHVNRKVMSIKAGDTAYIPPGAYQSLENTGDTDLLYITITDPAYRESVDSSAD
ncbi:MAG: cupin domain-containing protein [Methanomicrobium sp.]|nr:cupin domain-containing protein [Methanomicrobium sp.]